MGVNPGEPIPKAARAPFPAPIPGRCHVCSPACGSGPPELPPFPYRLRVSALATARGSPAARDPERPWGLGSAGERLSRESSLGVGAAGGGAWTLTHHPLPSLGSPPPAEARPREQWEREGGRGPARQRPSRPRLWRLFLPPGAALWPSRSLRGGSAWAWHCGGPGWAR